MHHVTDADYWVEEPVALARSMETVRVFNPYSRTGCLLCDETDNGMALSVSLNLYDRIEDKIIIGTPNFLVIPDISPVIPGHTLLITRAHVPCFARLPANLGSEFQAVKREATCFVTRQFSAPFLFEHGSVEGRSGSGVCICHAHIHLIPARLPVRPSMEAFGAIIESSDVFGTVRGLGESATDYLSYEDQDGRGYLASRLDQPPPCQFIRRVVADHLDLDDWNWKSIFGENREDRPRGVRDWGRHGSAENGANGDIATA